MKRPVLRFCLVAAGLLLVLGQAVRMLPAGLELHIRPVDSPESWLVLPLAPGERFTLHYYHSVENAPIWEEHSMDAAGKIYIEEERYEKFGAGMGKMPGVGRMVKKGNLEAIVDMHMLVGAFVLRVGSSGVGHTIFWRDRQINLSEKFAHQALEFYGKAIPFSDRIKRLISSAPHQTATHNVKGNFAD